MKIIPASVQDHAPILHRSATEISFRVDEVEPCPEPCIPIKTRARVRQDIGRPVLACSHDESSEVILEGGAATHGLVNAVYVAFSQHRPLGQHGVRSCNQAFRHILDWMLGVHSDPLRSVP